jgi:DNA polymerase III subunit delta
MRLTVTQLIPQLQRKLSPVYLLTGDEPLQMMECSDAVRHQARKLGFSERVVFDVDKQFDWYLLRESADSLSLFAQRRLLELRLTDKTPNNEGSKILSEYVQSPPDDIILLITAAKLDASKQKAKWFTAVEQHGVVVPIWPVDASKLPEWVAARLRCEGFQAEADVAYLIAERSEGHLLACAQEIAKLNLLYGKGVLTLAQAAEAIADNARFEVFDWIDTLLDGDIRRGVRQLQTMRFAIEPVLLLWALEREIRTLALLAYIANKGQINDSVFKQYRIWDKRKKLIIKAIKRHPVQQWQRFLLHCGLIDRIIKGMAAGNVWDEILYLATRIAGLPDVLQIKLE